MVAVSRWLPHDPAQTVCVLCFDEVTARVLGQEFEGRVLTVPVADLHAAEPRLPPLRPSRTPWEFLATHKPVFLAEMLNRGSAFDWIAFIDADTASYRSLTPVFDELAGASIGLSPHRFPDDDQSGLRYGRYNAGFLCFRPDDLARECLRCWTEDCLDWCHERPLPDGRYMNQGYLTAWPRRHPGVHVIGHPGANLAPWNILRHGLKFGPSELLVDDQPLLFFHFSAVHRMPDGTWASLHSEPLKALPEVGERLYKPYLREIVAMERALHERHGITGTGSVRFKT